MGVSDRLLVSDASGHLLLHMATHAELGRWRHHCHPHLHHRLSVTKNIIDKMQASYKHAWVTQPEERSQAGTKSQNPEVWTSYLCYLSNLLYKHVN